jgi:hypothetical protein
MCRLKDYFMRIMSPLGVTTCNMTVCRGDVFNAVISVDRVVGRYEIKTTYDFPDEDRHFLETYRVPDKDESYEKYHVSNNSWQLVGFGGLVYNCTSVKDDGIIKLRNLVFELRGFDDDMMLHVFELLWPGWKAENDKD